MALLGLSLILASIVYLAIRRPPLIETLVALCRGSPRIQRPPPARLQPDTDEVSSRGTTRAEADRAPLSKMPSPALLEVEVGVEVEVEIAVATTTTMDAVAPLSPQTTPKAKAATAPVTGAVPSFSLSPSVTTSPSPPAPTAAAVARGATTSSTTTSTTKTQPSLSAPTPAMSMPPPPRPPRLNAIANAASPSSSLAPPPRLSPLPNRAYDRQPGTSTLAPPPSHSSKPSKPSRKVTLEPGHSPLDWARLANHPTADLRNLGSGAPYIRVTPSMLKRQTGRRGKDAWTALGGRVYNISPYLPFHPGGEPELLRAAGRDGTRLFGEIHPWVNYETMLSSCLIGLLVDESEANGTGEMEAMD